MDTDLATPGDTAVVDEAEDLAYLQARERAEMIQGLYIHILVYAVINAGLFAINWFTRGDNGAWWFQWPLLIWGIGLMVHVVVTVVPIFSPEWVDRRAHQMVSRRRF